MVTVDRPASQSVSPSAERRRRQSYPKNHVAKSAIPPVANGYFLSPAATHAWQLSQSKKHDLLVHVTIFLIIYFGITEIMMLKLASLNTSRLVLWWNAFQTYPARRWLKTWSNKRRHKKKRNKYKKANGRRATGRKGHIYLTRRHALAAKMYLRRGARSKEIY